MDGGKTWYLCDSEKNTECRRTNCWMCRRYGSRAIYESRQLQQPCNLTSRREYAMEDNQGRLIRVKIWKDRQRGFLCEFNYEEKNGGQEHESVHHQGRTEPHGGGGNPEYAPDQELVKGIEADGFLLMTMKDDRPGAVVIHSITTLDLARMLAGDKSEAGSVIRQAMAISEGLLKAEEIKKTEDRNTMARNLAEILRSK